MDPVYSARDSLVLLKCALYTEEKSTTVAKKKKKKKKRKTQNVNPNRTLMYPQT